MAKLIYHTENQEYSELITKFIAGYNPTFHAGTESRVEAIMEILIASRNIRLGPAPSIESQFYMRDVIRYSIENSKPIPILIPAGPKKTKEGEGIDIAELSTLNILNCVNQAIKLHYPLGTEMIMRLEDMTGMVLEPEYENDMIYYIHQLTELIGALGYDFITPWKESEHEREEEFIPMAQEVTDIFFRYIKDTEFLPQEAWKDQADWKMLKHLEWSGIIPIEQRQMYIEKYEKLFPGISKLEAMVLMSKYFGAALARKTLNMAGNKPEWGDKFLEIAFMPPVPEYNYPRRFYYRSIELCNSKRAIPFWRSKGFLKISEDNTIRLSSVTWLEAKDMEFHEGTIIFSTGKYEAHVKCDYILTD